MFNGTAMAKINDQKHLGLILDSSKGNLNENIKKNIGINTFPSSDLIMTLDLMYKAIVPTHLEYCDIIYHTPPRLRLA